MNKKVLAFIITRGGSRKRIEQLSKLLDDIDATAGYPYHMKVYFNGCEELPETSPSKGVGVIRCAENTGQHPPFNAALQQAIEGDYDYLLRLDDDVKFLTKRNWLRKLVDAAEAYAEEKGMALTPE